MPPYANPQHILTVLSKCLDRLIQTHTHIDPHVHELTHVRMRYILPYITFDMNQKEVTLEHLFTAQSIKNRPSNECEMLVLDSYLFLYIFDIFSNFLVKFG